jgi:prepilin-type N-terminal cleavage/methylation domain-containing protein
MRYFRIKSGFTLIEVIVAVSILIILMTVSLANFRSGEKNRRLGLSAEGIVSAIRLAQNYSLAGKQVYISGCANTAPLSYRVEFSSSSSSYQIYGENSCGTVLIESSSLLQQTVFNAQSLQVANLNGDVTTPAIVNLKFTPPFGLMSVSTTSGASAVFSKFRSIGITVLLETDASRTRTVNVDGVSGRIGE